MKNLFRKTIKKNFVGDNDETITVEATSNGWTIIYPEGTTSYKNKKVSAQYYMDHAEDFLGKTLSTTVAAE